MRVTLVVNGFPEPSRPHYDSYNQPTARELSKHVDLTLIVPHAIKPGRKLVSVDHWEGIPIIRVAAPVIPGMHRLTLRLYQRFARSLLHPYLKHADIVHSMDVSFAGLMIGAFADQYNFCHVTQFINNVLCLRHPKFKQYPYLDKLRHNLKAVVCNSRELVKIASKLFPQTKVVRAAYRGTDLSRFNPTGSKAESLSKRGAIRFLFLGGIPSYPNRLYDMNTKGGLTLMEAWKSAEEEMLQSDSILLFGGPNTDGKLFCEWRDSLRYPDLVIQGGLIPPQEVPDYHRAADVVLVPSMEEGCPNVAFEACASGKAIFGSDIGPVAEVVKSGETGLLLKAGSSNAWRDALITYSKPEYMKNIRSMGTAARVRAETLFDHRKYATQLVEIYREAAKLTAN